MLEDKIIELEVSIADSEEMLEGLKAMIKAQKQKLNRMRHLKEQVDAEVGIEQQITISV